MPELHNKNILDTKRDDLRVGVISDTHGLLRPEVISAFIGVSLIIHAGDVGRPAVLEALGNIAPVVAVRGNTDRDAWAFRLPLTEVVSVAGVSIYVLHDLGRLDLNPAVSGFNAVISGHTHEPAIENKNNVLFINPGSSGPKRFILPVSIALLHINNGSLKAELVTLKV
jgi:putative phosphoesterase